MSAKSEPANEPTTASSAENAGFSCDFCGRDVPSVQRVALDGDYERLRTPHKALYACPTCSEQKSRDREERGTG